MFKCGLFCIMFPIFSNSQSDSRTCKKKSLWMFIKVPMNFFYLTIKNQNSHYTKPKYYSTERFL